jgi:hypothetical protein
MVRSTGEVQADIALMRRVIERKLDALHDRLPVRWWLSYAWLGGGFATGLLLSRVPLLTMTASALRLVQLGLGLVATMKSVQRVLEAGSPRQGSHRGVNGMGARHHSIDTPRT